MDRLTGYSGGKVFFKHGKESGIQTYADAPMWEYVESITRLAAYEDTNLSPDEITAALSRLAEYEAAEREGRLVRLPCKVGTVIYCINRNNHWGAHTPWYERDLPEEMKTPKFIIQKEQFNFMHLNAFGKTVFLTRAEAEKGEV